MSSRHTTCKPSCEMCGEEYHSEMHDACSAETHGRHEQMLKEIHEDVEVLRSEVSDLTEKVSNLTIQISKESVLVTMHHKWFIGILAIVGSAVATVVGGIILWIIQLIKG